MAASAARPLLLAEPAPGARPSALLLVRISTGLSGVDSVDAFFRAYRPLAGHAVGG